MSRARIYVRNLAANWFGYGANLVVMFFISPFVVHSLGDVRYGVWSLLMSLTGYLGLVEIGTRAGLGRYINYYLGRGDIPKANGIINTALAIFAVVGVLLLVVASGLGAFLGMIFTKIPEAFVPGARIVLLLVALNLWLSFIQAAFRQILTAFERFDLINATAVMVLGLRTAGTVVALTNGGGITSLALVHVGSSLVAVVATAILARRTFPELRLSKSGASGERFRELFGFSIWAFVGNIAMNLLWWTDATVITILLGPAMVTFYSIPLMLVHYGRGVVGQFATILGPHTIKASSVGDFRELRDILRWGSKVNMLLAIPMFAGMIFFGGQFIELWMGRRYSASGPILMLLAIPQLVVQATRAGWGIINGLGYVRFAATMALVQGLINLGLTLLFVMAMGLGLQGVALGTMVPMVVFNVVMGGFVLRWIRYPAREFISDNVLRYIYCTMAFSLICYLAGLLPVASNWPSFVLKVAAALALFLPLSIYLLFGKDERQRMRRAIHGVFSRAEGLKADAYPRADAEEAVSPAGPRQPERKEGDSGFVQPVAGGDDVPGLQERHE